MSSTSPNLRRLLKRLRQHPTRPAGRILFTRAELRYSLVLGIVRNGRRVMFWEDPQLGIEPQDQLIVMDARHDNES